MVDQPVRTWVRRTYLINRPFQLRVIAFVAITALVACAAFFAGSMYFFDKYNSYAVQAGLKISHPFFMVLANMQDMMTWIFVFTSLAIMVFSAIAGLLLSHKVAGPMYKLQKHCESVARGETLEDIRFRKGDFFPEVAQAYNEQMQFIRSKLQPTQSDPDLKKSA